MSAITGPVDVHDYHRIVEQIHAIDPKWQAPPATQAGYKIAREKFQAVSAEPYIRPNAQQQALIDLGHKQTATATKLADFVHKGLARYEDFQLPDDDFSTEERWRAINKIDARLNEIWEEHSWSDGHRAKVAWHHVKKLEARCDELQDKLAAAIGRIHDLEQIGARH